jgi:hypothetical protein
MISTYELGGRLSAVNTVQSIGEYPSPKGIGSVSIGPMRGTDTFLAEVLVLKGMGVGDVEAGAGPEGGELVRGVGVLTHEGPELETGARDCKGREE